MGVVMVGGEEIKSEEELQEKVTEQLLSMMDDEKVKQKFNISDEQAKKWKKELENGRAKMEK